ncbi:P-loop containing nucleoside triphosphate hydrolase protein [Mycena leptocephala]|nr:P-loop containing nucleoside triphosphate hydrolase protein [Mycena leptocephala]
MQGWPCSGTLSVRLSVRVVLEVGPGYRAYVDRKNPGRTRSTGNRIVQPLVSGGSVVDGMKLVVIGGRSSAWNHFVNSFFLTAHFSEEDHPYDWLMLWLSRRPPDEFADAHSFTASKTRVIFQPTFDTTHTIYWRGHWLRVRRARGADGGEVLSVSVVARSNTILKALVLQAKREYEAEAVHRIQIFFADPHGSWRWADARHKRPMGSIVLDPGVKEMLLGDARDFLASEKWYADRGIPFRRGSLIHAIAGELMLDIYVVSLSSAWISDSDLDAAFTRSVSRQDDGGGQQVEGPELPPKRRSRDKMRDRDRDGMSDLNTLSLSGLLNALDGVAAAEGRILFATTNHLEKLDPALSRPGAWTKWQAEALFRNFFPSTDEDELPLDEGDIDLPSTPTGSVRSSGAGSSRSASTSSSGARRPSRRARPTAPREAGVQRWECDWKCKWKWGRQEKKEREMPALPQFGSSNKAYLPPPVAPEIVAAQHSARPLDGKTLANLAKRFADSIPEGEFSVAALQGYLLKNKSRPEAAAMEAAAWVVSEREMRERLQKEKEAKETREKAEVRFSSSFFLCQHALTTADV